RNLIKTLERFHRITPDSENTSCGFLYISACFLLRDDGRKRGPLPDGGAGIQRSLPVLKFTIDNMPRLKNAILMGSDASLAVKGTPLLALLEERNIRVHSVSHPARALSDAERFTEWEPVFGRPANGPPTIEGTRG
ncbi:MAG: hypothetical protein CMJ61_04345, partial [Planctomycetaceae bacterium]|nr:hypothetical protein [Planctomycetaceae bacterium]